MFGAGLQHEACHNGECEHVAHHLVAARVLHRKSRTSIRKSCAYYNEIPETSRVYQKKRKKRQLSAPHPPNCPSILLTGIVNTVMMREKRGYALSRGLQPTYSLPLPSVVLWHSAVVPSTILMLLAGLHSRARHQSGHARDFIQHAHAWPGSVGTSAGQAGCSRVLSTQVLEEG